MYFADTTEQIVGTYIDTKKIKMIWLTIHIFYCIFLKF